MRYLSAIFALPALFVSSISYADTACKPWDGNINNNPAEICLTIASQGNVTGTYFYFKHSTPIALHGTFDQETQQLTLFEQQEKVHPETVTGTWTGVLDKNQSKFTGTWKSGKDTLPFVFYDLTAHPFKTSRHEEIDGSCDFEEDIGYALSFTNYNYTWDNVISLPNPDMLPLFQGLLKENRPEWAGAAIISNHPQKIKHDSDACEKKFDEVHIKQSGTHDKTKWDEAFGVYDDMTTILIRPVGKYLISITSSWNSYTGGAHPNEKANQTFYDLRTGEKVPFLDLFTKEGQDILYKTILTDFDKTADCNVDLNKIWDFGPDTADQHDLTQWGISYGTYAFGCTGRPGYSLDKLPEPLVKQGLNPIYFDPKTKFFY